MTVGVDETFGHVPSFSHIHWQKVNCEYPCCRLFWLNFQIVCPLRVCNESLCSISNMQGMLILLIYWSCVQRKKLQQVSKSSQKQKTTFQYGRFASHLAGPKNHILQLWWSHCNFQINMLIALCDAKTCAGDAQSCRPMFCHMEVTVEQRIELELKKLCTKVANVVTGTLSHMAFPAFPRPEPNFFSQGSWCLVCITVQMFSAWVVGWYCHRHKRSCRHFS